MRPPGLSHTAVRPTMYITKKVAITHCWTKPWRLNRMSLIPVLWSKISTLQVHKPVATWTQRGSRSALAMKRTPDKASLDLIHTRAMRPNLSSETADSQ